jgi:hypothetical protein
MQKIATIDQWLDKLDQATTETSVAVFTPHQQSQEAQ